MLVRLWNVDKDFLYHIYNRSGRYRIGTALSKFSDHSGSSGECDVDEPHLVFDEYSVHKDIDTAFCFITISNNTVTVTPSNEKNPCYLMAANQNTITTLSLNVCQTISHGDKFSFIPMKVWFLIEIDFEGDDESIRDRHGRLRRRTKRVFRYAGSNWHDRVARYGHLIETKNASGKSEILSDIEDGQQVSQSSQPLDGEANVNVDQLGQDQLDQNHLDQYQVDQDDLDPPPAHEGIIQPNMALLPADNDDLADTVTLESNSPRSFPSSEDESPSASPQPGLRYCHSIHCYTKFLNYFRDFQ